ncbi:hypothetical protein LIP66_05550 [Coprococcus eutactus]|uniref:hypothetical protein n=1 Tax=Coprococcus TaxID=33042 RepID=UPI00156F4D56|nr:hypothetical protein [Coprococcus eutactus]MCB5504101.1 hypothetical protein [Coprococcus eutactus]NSC95918.1 hypothetical protein [Coprococcus eutactus]NSD35047.1 hypothetical protein [Coprococcus eutactus]
MGLKEENYIENDLKEIRSSKMWLIKSIFSSITKVLAAIIILGLTIIYGAIIFLGLGIVRWLLM